MTQCLDNDEEAVKSQYRGQCALRDGFVTIFFISVARRIVESTVRHRSALQQ